VPIHRLCHRSYRPHPRYRHCHRFWFPRHCHCRPVWSRCRPATRIPLPLSDWAYLRVIVAVRYRHCVVVIPWSSRAYNGVWHGDGWVLGHAVRMCVDRDRRVYTGNLR